MHLISATIHCGHGITKTLTDLVLDCQSKKEAKQKYHEFLKKDLPTWQKIIRVVAL